jgi:hypothetical protein
MELPPEDSKSRTDRKGSNTERKLDLLFLFLVDERVWNLNLYPEPERAYRVLRDTFERIGFDFTIDKEVLHAFDALSEFGDRKILGSRIWEALESLDEQYGQLQTSFEGIADLKERLVLFEKNQNSFLEHQQEQRRSTLGMSNSILEIAKNNADMANNYSKIADNYSRLTTEQTTLSTLVNEMKINLDKVLADYAKSKDKQQ